MLAGGKWVSKRVPSYMHTHILYYINLIMAYFFCYNSEPVEGAVRERVNVVPRQFLSHKEITAALLCQLRELSIIAECVYKQHQNMMAHPEAKRCYS